MPVRKPIRERFEIFHATHPEVYEWFDYFAKEMLAAGVKKVGAPCLWERIRYESYITTGEQPYRLPNELRPYYAREFQRLNPALANRIRTRKLRDEIEAEREAA